MGVLGKGFACGAHIPQARHIGGCSFQFQWKRPYHRGGNVGDRAVRAVVEWIGRENAAEYCSEHTVRTTITDRHVEYTYDHGRYCIVLHNQMSIPNSACRVRNAPCNC
jgi:hypothetical protein